MERIEQGPSIHDLYVKSAFPDAVNLVCAYIGEYPGPAKITEVKSLRSDIKIYNTYLLECVLRIIDYIYDWDLCVNYETIADYDATIIYDSYTRTGSITCKTKKI